MWKVLCFLSQPRGVVGPWKNTEPHLRARPQQVQGESRGPQSGSEGTVRPAQVLTWMSLETARSDLECRTNGGGRDMEEEGVELEK